MKNSLFIEQKLMVPALILIAGIILYHFAISMVDSFNTEATKASTSLSQTLSNPLGSNLHR